MPQSILDFNPLEDYKFCPACGFELEQMHAKTVCNRCGYKKGCCDLL